MSSPKQTSRKRKEGVSLLVRKQYLHVHVQGTHAATDENKEEEEEEECMYIHV